MGGGNSMKRWVCSVMLVAFMLTSVVPSSYAQSVLSLPSPGQMVALSPAFNPPVLKGIKVYPDNPFRFDFILDKGDDKSTDEQIKIDSTRLIKYFLASLTIPEKDLWVNLSPYEKDRIVPEAFGQTEMGRDLLAQDYLLKQITASIIYPEGDIGKRFWKKIYALAQEKYGTTDIPVDTFNKVWIVPEKAVVYENGKVGAAYVTESRLKVMLETDYLADEMARRGSIYRAPCNGSDCLENRITPGAMNGAPTSEAAPVSDIAKSVLREIVIPVLEQEVNEGKNFAKLRQVYQSLILAAWYKRKIKQSLLSAVYVDQKKTDGVNIADPKEAEQIWGQYVEAFKKGTYNFVKEERDMFTDDVLPRKYFSGGADLAMSVMTIVHEGSLLLEENTQNTLIEKVEFDAAAGNMQDQKLEKVLNIVRSVYDRPSFGLVRPDSLKQRIVDIFPDLVGDYRSWVDLEDKMRPLALATIKIALRSSSFNSFNDLPRSRELLTEGFLDFFQDGQVPIDRKEKVLSWFVMTSFDSRGNLMLEHFDEFARIFLSAVSSDKLLAIFLALLSGSLDQVGNDGEFNEQVYAIINDSKRKSYLRAMAVMFAARVGRWDVLEHALRETSPQDVDTSLGEVLTRLNKNVGVFVTEVSGHEAFRGLVRGLQEVSDGRLREFKADHLQIDNFDGEAFAPENSYEDTILLQFHDFLAGVQLSTHIFNLLPYYPFKVAAPVITSEDRRGEIRRAIGFENKERKIIILGSLTEAETRRFLKDFKLAYQGVSDERKPLIILAPRARNPAEVLAIDQVLRDEGLSVVQRNPGDDWRNVSDQGALLLNTQGELNSLYSIADVAFVGEDRNIMEPLVQGIATFAFPGDWLNNGMVLDKMAKSVRMYGQSSVDFLRNLPDSRSMSDRENYQRGRLVIDAFDDELRQTAANVALLLKLLAIFPAKGLIDQAQQNVSGSFMNLSDDAQQLIRGDIGQESDHAALSAEIDIPVIGQGMTRSVVVRGIRHADQLGRDVQRLIALISQAGLLMSQERQELLNIIWDNHDLIQHTRENALAMRDAIRTGGVGAVLYESSLEEYGQSLSDRRNLYLKIMDMVRANSFEDPESVIDAVTLIVLHDDGYLLVKGEFPSNLLHFPVDHFGWRQEMLKAINLLGQLAPLIYQNRSQEARDRVNRLIGLIDRGTDMSKAELDEYYSLESPEQRPLLEMAVAVLVTKRKAEVARSEFMARNILRISQHLPTGKGIYLATGMLHFSDIVRMLRGDVGRELRAVNGLEGIVRKLTEKLRSPLRDVRALRWSRYVVMEQGKKYFDVGIGINGVPDVTVLADDKENYEAIVREVLSDGLQPSDRSKENVHILEGYYRDLSRKDPWVNYVISMSGDTISGIAREFRSNIDRVGRLNPGFGIDDILPEGKIIVLSDSAALAGEENSSVQASIAPLVNSGGIDLSDFSESIQSTGGSDSVQFTFSPAMFREMVNLSGLIPRIIDVQPMKDLGLFLGL